MSTRFSMLRRGAWSLLGLALILAAMSGKAEAGAGPPQHKAVPEIDPGSILGAVTLLSGGFMILTDRRRSK